MLKLVENPPNPFHGEFCEWIDAPETKLQIFEERAKSIISTNDSPDIAFSYSVNPYRGCFHACSYCYARRTHQYLDFGAGTDFERKIVVKINAAQLLEQELRKPSWESVRPGAGLLIVFVLVFVLVRGYFFRSPRINQTRTVDKKAFEYSMARLRKYFVHGTVVEICSRVQEGLPFVATPYMTLLIEGILANAAALYPMTICHFVFMANHFHLIGIVENPADVPEFMRYLKGELAHAINRLQGRRQRTIWVAGYDAPTVLTADTVIDRMLYLYLNPVRAGLVDSISEYPASSSFSFLIGKESSRPAIKLPRDAICRLPSGPMEQKAQHAFTRKLMGGEALKTSVIIKPWEWAKCFPETANRSAEDLRRDFLKRFFNQEKLLSASRKTPRRGADSLRLQDPKASYLPKKHGKRMICLSSCTETRINFICWYKEQAKLAAIAFVRWRAGISELRPPPGFFTPGGVLFANALPTFLAAAPTPK